MRLLLIFLFTLMVSTVHAQDLAQVDKKHPVKFSGGLNLQLEGYSATGIENRRKPYTWVLTGSPVVEIYGVQLPFFFLFSNYENKYFQPFNQFGVSPYYKWVKVHLGYRNIQFSQFTLAGYRMLGGGVELTPGIFRFGFMYGQLNRSTTIDSIQNANPNAFRTRPSYTRMAYAGKIGIGNEKNFFDICYLKGWDEESSLRSDLRDSIAPEENKVVGFAWQVTFLKKIVWKTDIGGSVYTVDIHATRIGDSEIKQYAGEAVAQYLSLTTATSYQFAGESRIGYKGTNFGADLVYRRVDPNYKSMGAYFFQTDVEQYTLAPYANIAKGKLAVNGNVGMQHDNLNGAKLATSKRIIGNANINYNPSPKFGTSISYNNYGITQNPTRTSPADSNLFKQVSQNATVVPYVNLFNERVSQNFQLVASYMLLSNTTQSIIASSNQSTIIGTFLYSRTWLQSGISGNVSVNYNSTILPQGDFTTYGMGIGSSAAVFKKKASVNANVTVNSNTVNNKMNGYTINADVGGTLPLGKHNTIQVQCIYLDNESEDKTVMQSFSELTARITYGFTF